jgi:Ca2+-binding EF-hand superfamily protein
MSIPECRQAVVFAAFAKFDLNGEGSISAADLKSSFAGKIHPKVISNEMSEDEVFLEFLTNFHDNNQNGRIDWNEWCDHFASVSSRVDNDQHFEQLMCQLWML